jgi:hypothetical protein
LLYLESPVDLTQEVISEYAKRPKDKAGSDNSSGDKKK